MIPLLQSLVAHMTWADAAMWTAIRQHAAAAEDEALRINMHHIVLAQRAFLSLFLKRPFDLERELRAPEAFDDLAALYRAAQAEVLDFAASLDGAALERVIDMQWIPGSHPSLPEALMQVVLHSQHHRAQCAARLRALGGAPPMTDYITWLLTRPGAGWGSTPR